MALPTAKERVKGLDGLMRKLYEDNATGKIADKHFERLLVEYDSGQGGLEGRIEEIRNSITEYEKNTIQVDIYFNFVGQIDLSDPTMQVESADKLTTGQKKAKVP